ncbi:MAG: HU family DNA-binding protein, partial [Clostridia bacterium]|nr:HU family DNA-binding protein [Clostridia bacterium]
MNKTEFIKALSSQANLSLKDASAAVDGFIEVVATALKEGDKVAISGLGTFELKEKAARKGINPLTKEEIMIPASKSPSLKVGRLF